MKHIAVNQRLFATTLFLDLQEINWLWATNFHEENKIQETFEG